MINTGDKQGVVMYKLIALTASVFVSIFSTCGYSVDVRLYNIRKGDYSEFNLPDSATFEDLYSAVFERLGPGAIIYAGKKLAASQEYVVDGVTPSDRGTLSFIPRAPSVADLEKMSNSLNYSEEKRDLYFTLIPIVQAMKNNDWERANRKINTVILFNSDAGKDDVVKEILKEIEQRVAGG